MSQLLNKHLMCQITNKHDFFSPYFKIMMTEKIAWRHGAQKTSPSLLETSISIFISATCSAFLCSVKWRPFSAHKLSNWWRCFLSLLVFCLFTYFCSKRRSHWPVYHLLLWGIRGTWRYRRWQMTAGQVCNPGFQCCPVKRTETKSKHLFSTHQIEEHICVHRADSYSM